MRLQWDLLTTHSTRHGPVRSRDSSKEVEVTQRTHRRSALLLLLVPVVGLLCVPFYNYDAPTLWGVPFFYWYQLLWVPITVLLIWVVYRSTHDED